jgi:hypothetical protein
MAIVSTPIRGLVGRSARRHVVLTMELVGQQHFVRIGVARRREGGRIVIIGL